MKIPQKVKIAGFLFHIKCPHHFRGNRWAAEIDHDRHKILIADHSSLGIKKAHSEMEEAFLHEILHGINCRYLPHKMRLRENQIQQISQGLYQVLKDNKIKF